MDIIMFIEPMEASTKLCSIETAFPLQVRMYLGLNWAGLKRRMTFKGIKGIELDFRG
jgi:hypothetical protein